MASADDHIKDVFHVFGLLGGSVGVELLGWKHYRISSVQPSERSGMNEQRSSGNSRKTRCGSPSADPGGGPPLRRRSDPAASPAPGRAGAHLS